MCLKSDSCECASNLPDWPGASDVYSKLYRRLERMARGGHVEVTWFRGRARCRSSVDMDRIVKALDRGDEEELKGILVHGIGDHEPRGY